MNSWRSIALLLILSLLAARCEAEDLIFRKILVPKDRLEDYVGGLRPVSQRQFDALTRVDTRSEPAVWERGAYQATLDGELLRGSGQLKTRITQPNTMLSMDCQLPFTTAHWQRGDVQQPATLAIGEEGLVVPIEASFDELFFEWNQTTPPSDTNDVRALQIDFPDAFSHELQLQVPDGYIVSAHDALVEPNPQLGPNDSRSWFIRWNGDGLLRLSVRKSMAIPSVRVHSEVDIRSHAIRATYELQFDSLHGLDSLPLRLDPHLHLASAYFEEQRLAQIKTASNITMLELPSVPANQPVTIRIVGRMQPSLAPFQLPRIRPDCNILRETSQVRVHGPLSLSDLRLDRCTCTSITRDADQGTHVYGFRFESDLSSAMLHLRHNLASLTCETLCQTQVRESSVETRVSHRVAVTRGEVLELLIDSSSKWNLDEDSIEILQYDEEQAEEAQFEAVRDSQGNVKLTLAAAVTPQRPILISLTYARAESSNSIALPDLIPCQIASSDQSTTWLQIQGTPGLKLDSRGDYFARSFRRDSPPPNWIEASIQVTTVPSSNTNLFFEYTPNSESVTIRRTVVEALPRVTVTTHVKVSTNTLLHTLNASIDPQGQEIDQLVVLFPKPMPTRSWSFPGRSEVPTVDSVVRDDQSEQQTVRFSPTNEPFTLQFTCETPRSSLASFAIPAPAVLGVTGTGTLGVSVLGAIDLVVDSAAGFDAVPTAVFDSPAESRRLRGVYRYDLSAGTPAMMRALASALPPQQVAWIWRSDLRSIYSDSGRPQHRANFQVQNEGARELQLEFPDSYTLKSVEVNGKSLDLEPYQSILNVPIPETLRYINISVEFLERQRPLRAIERLRAPTLKADVPALQETWQVWLPKTFRSYQSHRFDRNPAEILHRLFGRWDIQATLEYTTLRPLRQRWVSDLDLSNTLARRLQILTGPGFLQQSDQSTTWGSRLQVIEQTIQRSRPNFRFLIDRTEMRSAGVSPDTPLQAEPELRKVKPLEIGTQRLLQNGLAFIIDGDTVVVTSSSAAKLRVAPANWITPVSCEGNHEWFGTRNLAPVETWIFLAQQDLWPRTADVLRSGVQQAGWQPTQCDITSQSSALKIYHQDTIAAVRSVLLCFGLTLGWWIARKRARLLIPLVSLFFTATLLLPQPGSTLTCSVAWALIAACLMRLSVRAKAPIVGSASWDRKQIAVRAAIWVAIGSTSTLWFTQESHAQNFTTESPTDKYLAEEHQVYVPTDEVGTPLQTVYMTDAFYRQLREREFSGQRPFAITRAKYTGTFDPQSLSLRINVRCDVLALGQNAVMPLPEFSAAHQWLPDSLKRNQEPIEPIYRSGEGPLVPLGPPELGTCRISYDVVCTWNRSLQNQRIVLPLAPAPFATLELKVPRQISRTSIPSALGEVTTKDGWVFANLGRTSELEIVATPSSGVRTKDVWPRVLRVVELFVGREQTLVTTKFVFPDDSAFPLRLNSESLDRALREITPETWNEQDAPIQFRLPTPTGRLAIPTITLKNARINATRVFVSSDSDKNVRLDDTLDGVAIVPTEIINEDNVDFQLEVESTDLPTLEVNDTPTIERWNNELSLFLDHRTTHIQLKTQLNPEYTNPRAVTVRRLRVSDSLRVRTVEATNANGVPQRLHWHRNENEIAIFFLDQTSVSASAPLEVTLRGELTDSSADELSVPRMEWISPHAVFANTRSVLQLFRAADVEITVDPQSIGSFIEESADDSLETIPRFRIHSVWVNDSAGTSSGLTEEPKPMLIRRVNRGDLSRGSRITRMIKQNGLWTTELEISFGENQTLPEAVYLELPQTLDGSALQAFHLSEAGERTPLRTERNLQGPHADRPLIELWLPPSFSQGSQRIVVSIPMKDGQQPNLPDIRLLNPRWDDDEGLGEQFVELPPRDLEDSQGPEFRWRHFGLTPVAAQRPNWLRFRISQDNHGAVLEEQTSGLKPEIILLDTQVDWQLSGHYVAISHFLLKPGQESLVHIDLPETTTVRQILINGRKATFDLLGPQANGASSRYALTLSSSPWPQSIRVFYDGRTSVSGRRIGLHAPRLAYLSGEPIFISVDRQVWNVQAPREAGTPTASTSEYSKADTTTNDAIQVRAFLELWTKSQAVIRDRSSEELVAFLSPWARHLYGPLTRLQPNTEDDIDWETLDAIRDRYPAAFDTPTDPFNIPAQDLWSESRWVSGANACFVRPAEPDPLPSKASTSARLYLTYPYVGNQGEWVRYGLIGMLLTLSGLTWWTQTTRHLATWMETNPHLTIILAGTLGILFPPTRWPGAALVVLAGTLWAALAIGNSRRSVARRLRP